MQQHRSQAELFGKPASMLPAGAAVGHQHATADVLPTMQGHTTNRGGHSLDRELQGTFCQLL